MKQWFGEVVNDFFDALNANENGWPEDKVELIGEFVKFAITYIVYGKKM